MTATAFDVVVVGNVGVDTNVYLRGADIDVSVESNFTENLDYVGQAGGYAARAYAQLGKATSFIGYVGSDFCGEFIRAEFSRDGIDTTGLFVDPEGSGRSVNLIQLDGGRRSLYDGKGHMDLAPDLALCSSVLSRAQLAHFSIPNWARRLLPLARNAGLRIACDIQDVRSPNDAYRDDFVNNADVLFFSTIDQPEPAPLMEKYIAANPDQIVITGLGAKGCALGTRDGIRVYPPVQLHSPVLDTTGAGDTLAVGFLTSYELEGYSLRDSILRGQIAARHTCSHRASTSNLITMQELDRHFAELRDRFPP